MRAIEPPFRNVGLWLVFAVLFHPMIAICQGDPLNSAYLPSMNTNAGDYPANIWITNGMQKVRQDSGSPGTQHWGTFYGTQNEFIDFQVHYQDTGSGTQNLSVTVSNFVQTAPSSFTISSAPTPLPPKVVVYREAYMDVTIPTAQSTPLYYGTTGYFPDALIPTIDPYWGQTTNAWPFNVPAGANQSAWIDVLIPQNAPAGYYLGTVTVSSGATTLATMPVILAVWQWPSAGYMPATPTLNTEEGVGGGGWEYGAMCQEMYNGTTSQNSDSGCANYPGANGADFGVTLTYLDGDLLMKDHRWDVGGPENIYPDLNDDDFTKYNALVGPIMNGGCTHAGTVCPILSGSKNTTKGMSLAGTNGQANYVDFENDFVTEGWGTAGNIPLYLYLWDEPGTDPNNWSQLNPNATALHGYASPSEPLLVTTDLAEATEFGGLNSIDIMVPEINDMDPQGGSLQRSTYNSWLASNCCGTGSSPTRQLWSYQTCSSAGNCTNGGVGGSSATWPNVFIDSYPAGNRVMEWLTFLHGQSGELYYDADYCYQTSAPCGYPTDPYDPWVSIYSHGTWGDGTLIYVGCIVPGHPCYMGPGVTTPIILPSLRLKLMRDGVQDYEYLNALTNAGQGILVQQQIATWITNSYTFEPTGTGLMAARQILGTTLHQLTYGGLAPSPPTNLLLIVQ